MTFYNKKPKKIAAFTLLELLLAVPIALMISIALAAIYKSDTSVAIDTVNLARCQIMAENLFGAAKLGIDLAGGSIPPEGYEFNITSPTDTSASDAEKRFASLHPGGMFKFRVKLSLSAEKELTINVRIADGQAFAGSGVSSALKTHLYHL
ncbi:MAG: hypothetical protein GX221_04245 [Candidatus Riflebacteria bacterium]|nr:hypothetical protein [Candidatus Riflebacteria bacterium]